MGGPRSTAVINTAVGKDTHVSENQPDPDGETAAARRLAEALDPSAIDALLADAKAAGTPIDGVDGLLNQMTMAVLERSLQTEMTHHLGYDRDDPAGHAGGRQSQMILRSWRGRSASRL